MFMDTSIMPGAERTTTEYKSYMLVIKKLASQDDANGGIEN